MSVLIEALCPIIRRSSLDESYIGGADVFVEDIETEPAFRYVIADSNLVAIGVLDPDSLIDVVERLREIGLSEATVDQFTNDFVLVDMESWDVEVVRLGVKGDKSMKQQIKTNGEDVMEE